MASDNERERAQDALDALVRMFQTGELPNAVANTMIQKDRNDRPMDSWSLSNQIIATWTASRCRSRSVS